MALFIAWLCFSS